MKRAVIVGCGNIAAVHAAVLTAQKDTELVDVADIHFEKAQDYAERFHTKPYASLEEMIEKEQPDVLHVCTPHYLHVPMTQYALERDINVFMEKPPAITFAQLDQLKQAVYASKAKLGLCYQNRMLSGSTKADDLYIRIISGTKCSIQLYSKNNKKIKTSRNHKSL